MRKRRRHFSKCENKVKVEEKTRTRKYVKKQAFKTRIPPKRLKKEEASIRIKNDYKILQKTHSKRIIKEEPLTDSQELFSCSTCHYQSKAKSTITLHNWRHKYPLVPFCCYTSTLPSYVCYKCNFRTSLFLNLSQHKCYQHSQSLVEFPETYCCTHCEFESHSRLHLLKHSHACTSSDDFLSKRKRRDYHKCYQFLMQIKHANIEWLKCEKCSYMARLAGNTAKHMSDVHAALSKLKWFECGKCLVNVEQIFHLRQHILKEHGESVDDVR